jgi:CheY-like chemotaxis protein
MIIDDDRTTVKLLKLLLELDGYEVASADRGADALPRAREVSPDIVMVDYHLTDMTGSDVITTLRAEPAFARTPIVVTSGMNVEREALDAGANKFLLKPFEPSSLPSLFGALLAR